MVLTFAEDFTSNSNLDSELLGSSESGLFWNRGTHPIVTINNLLSHLPNLSITFDDYAIGTTYGKFEDTRKRSDIVTYNSKIYQSIASNNTGNTPDVSSAQWLETNIDSLRIKSFIYSVYDNALSALTLNRKLLENQYIYNVGEELNTLSGDYSGWAFEPKGSDYVKIRINQMSLQANTTDPQTVYVVNQGRLITTLTLNPNNGLLEFEDVDYTFYGKGRFLFIIDSQEVVSDNAYNDALKYKGFVCYPVNGIGATAQSAEYTESSMGNGINFNVSCYLDSSIYIENNKIDLAKFYQVQFALDFLKMLLHNTNTRSNRDQRNSTENLNKEIIAIETMNLDMGTVIKDYSRVKKQAVEAINRTFDKFLHKKKGVSIKRSVV